MRILLNGEERSVGEGATVADLVREAALGERGVAVAVDAEVVPRGEWSDTLLTDGQRVEILAAIQGGAR